MIKGLERQRLRILVVDDSPEDRAIYRRLLTQSADADYELTEAESADEGLEMLRAGTPDCILLDYRLPDMTGLEFLLAMADQPPASPVAVVMLTGQGDEQVAVEAMKCGAQDYLSKGNLEPDALHTAIQSALRVSRLQTALDEKHKLLERSNRDLERYARVVAHDLEAPLKGIRAGLSALLDSSGDRLDPQSDEFVRESIETAGRMTDLIRDILDYSRARANSTPLDPVDMARVAALAVANLRPHIEASGATVKIEPLPNVMGSESQLVQLVQNLVGNAIKYRSKAPPVIHIWAERLGDLWRFGVRDNGMGIDPRQADRIFDPFVRLHPAAEIEGTGVGLAICRELVERIGGKIWVESDVGKGSTFFFTIPVIDADQVGEKREATSRATSS